MTPLEAMQRVLRGERVEGLPMRLPPPVASTVGFALVAMEEGSAVTRMEATVARHANPMGTVHGGILCDLADAAMGMAAASTLAEGESFTTLELSMNFLRPVLDATLEARARVVHRGRTMLYVECDVVTAEGKPVARSKSTVLVLRGEMAKGR
ncbi:MAG TPA: PaaI family thioesterase [Anaeromyxobacteraceae bacterium]|jgi:uncharacterized protein (TIGR00369 family)